MAVNDVYRVSIEFQGPGGAGQFFITPHYEVQASLGSAEAEAEAVCIATEANWFTDALGAQMQQFMSSSVSAIACHARNLMQPTIGYDYIFPAPVGGGVAGDMLPPQDAMVVTLQTGKVGRSYRGRLYLPGLPETSQVGGLFVTGLTADVQDAIEKVRYMAYLGALGAFDFLQCVWSKKLSEATVVSQYTPKGVVRTQRRRSRLVGS